MPLVHLVLRDLLVKEGLIEVWGDLAHKGHLVLLGSQCWTGMQGAASKLNCISRLQRR